MKKKINKDEIEKFISKYLSTDDLMEDVESTFLSVIDKTKRETYISKILAYAIKNNYEFRIFILNAAGCQFEFSQNDEIKIICEKYMGGPRADIYVEISTPKKEKITLTIENKVDTQEHDDQTQEYYNWVEKQNTEYNNYYLYIYPDYNPSKPSCNSFKELKYSEIGKKIESEDYILVDFKKHINQYLGERIMEISNKDRLLIDNYYVVKQMEKELTDKVKEIQITIINKVKEIVNSKAEFQIVDWREYSKSVDWKNFNNEDDNVRLVELQLPTSIRIYSPFGYVKDRIYYYSEIRFDDDDIFETIKFQNTLCIYDKELRGKYEDFFDHIKLQFSKFLVLSEKEFKTTENKFSEEWICELCRKWIEFIEDSYKKTLSDVLDVLNEIDK